ncbi:MAG: phage antirepressor KilAC domain-containing protein, partial [Dysosmobacter sp.]
EKAWNTPEQVMARALKLADRTIDTLKEDNKKLIEENERMKPKEIFADAVSASTSSILIGDLAKLLRQNGVDTGQKRLFEQLRNEGYLMKTGSSRNMPTQRYVADGLFQIKETVISNPDGSVRMTKTTKVTGKGQQYFLNKYLKKEEAV